MHHATLLACSVLLASHAAAQTPYVPRSDAFVTDATNDRVLRLRDLDADGDYGDLGEIEAFYDDTLGPYPLGNNNCIASRGDGALFLADTAQDFVLTLRDLDGDGNAHGLGEAVVFFQSVANAAGIEAQAINGLALSGDVVWAAVAQGGTTGKDFVLRLEDLNGDLDANDANEAREYFVRADMAVPGTSSADSLVQDVEIGADGNVYYLEVGTSGLHAKGIYALVDSDGSGTIDPTEVAPFFLPAPQAGAAFHWGIEEDAGGHWYVQDTGNEIVWRARDADGSGAIDPALEATAWWTSATASLVWDTHPGADGFLYVSESQNNERIFLMRDVDGSGTIEAAEVVVAYDELTALGAAIGQIRGFVLDARWQTPWVPYCSAQTNVLGCAPAIACAGWPSASHGSGFLVRATNVRNNKPALLLYTLGGRDALPFNGGLLCVAPPVRRTGGQVSGGSPAGADCTGALSFDFNALVASGANPALLEGALVGAQYWSRDPGSIPGHTNLTSAVEFTLLR